MAVKIVPKEITSMMRALILKYGISSGIVLFVSFVFGYYGAYSFTQNNIGNTIIFGLISLGLFMVGTSVIIYKIADHEVKLSTSPSEIEFWRDVEAVEAKLMPIDQFLQKHAVDVLRVTRFMNEYVVEHAGVPPIPVSQQGKDINIQPSPKASDE